MTRPASPPTFDVDPLTLLRPRRAIAGASAVLLPWSATGEIDWSAWEAHLARTLDAGLMPAVNMDTGYVHLLDLAAQDEVLRRTRALAGGRAFFAGAAVTDRPGDAWNPGAYQRRFAVIQEAGGTPVVFPSHGLSGLGPAEWLAAHERLGQASDGFLAFELGPMFSPAGRIVELDTFAGLLDIAACRGAKHSSLDRRQEWQRLAVRNARRPDFRLYTGNDLAIDMVMYGSDYLLGLSTLAPDLFAFRDRLWEAGDARFYEWNDLLQYLGAFAFREPVPAYRHSAAQWLVERGWLTCDATPPAAPRRPDSDRQVLAELWRRLEPWAARAETERTEPLPRSQP